VFEIHDIAIMEIYLNPKYTISKTAATMLNDTGLLKVFEITPSNGGTVVYSTMGRRES